MMPAKTCPFCSSASRRATGVLALKKASQSALIWDEADPPAAVPPPDGAELLVPPPELPLPLPLPLLLPPQAVTARASARPTRPIWASVARFRFRMADSSTAEMTLGGETRHERPARRP